jgi:hypothetical protein
MELKAGKLSDVIIIRDHHHLTVTLTHGCLKLFLKGDAGIKICFFSSVREQLYLDVSGYESLILEAFEDCSYTYTVS